MEKDWDTNVEVVQLKSRSHCVARVWERSVGITMACGRLFSRLFSFFGFVFDFFFAVVHAPSLLR
jgi:hypothetical protein